MHLLSVQVPASDKKLNKILLQILGQPQEPAPALRVTAQSQQIVSQIKDYSGPTGETKKVMTPGGRPMWLKSVLSELL